MRRPGYREAVEWLACNDDCYWLGDDEPTMSVTASLVRDLWDVSDGQFLIDLRRALHRAHPTHAALNVGEGSA